MGAFPCYQTKKTRKRKIQEKVIKEYIDHSSKSRMKLNEFQMEGSYFFIQAYFKNKSNKVLKIKYKKIKWSK